MELYIFGFLMTLICMGARVDGYRSYYLAAQSYPEFPSLEHSVYGYKDFKVVSNYKPLGKFKGSQYILDIPVTNGRAGTPKVVGAAPRAFVRRRYRRR